MLTIIWWVSLLFKCLLELSLVWFCLNSQSTQWSLDHNFPHSFCGLQLLSSKLFQLLFWNIGWNSLFKAMLFVSAPHICRSKKGLVSFHAQWGNHCFPYSLAPRSPFLGSLIIKLMYFSEFEHPTHTYTHSINYATETILRMQCQMKETKNHGDSLNILWTIRDPFLSLSYLYCYFNGRFPKT